MDDNEKVVEFFSRKISDQTILENIIMRALTPKFDYIIVAIEEYKRLEVLKVEELQGSFEAYEQRVVERGLEKSSDHQALYE